MSTGPTAVDVLLAELETARPIVAAAEAWGAAHRAQVEALHVWQQERFSAGVYGNTEAYKAMNATYEAAKDALDVLFAALPDQKETK